MGIRRAKLPTTILEPSDDLGLASLMRLGSKVKEEQEDLSYLDKKSALLTVTGDDVFDVEALINESIASIALVPKDLKYDDSSMPQAPNFLDWCEGPDFLNARPYLEQALAGIRLFAEYCPSEGCSDNEWIGNLDAHDPKMGTAIIREKLTLMEYGVCPKCGKTRLDHFKSGALNFYNELVLLWGQRCVVGSTLVLTSNGLEYIGDICAGYNEGFTEAQFNVFNGSELETSSHVFVGKPESLFRVTAEYGVTIKGTGDHPVKTKRGWVTLKDIRCSDYIQVELGTNCFGSSVWTDTKLDFDSIPKEVLTGTKDTVYRYLELLRHALRDEPALSHRFRSELRCLLMNIGILVDTNFVVDGTLYEALLDLRERPKSTVFLRVTNTDDVYAETTYDFTLPITHQFISNGIVSHNSGKSEVAAMITSYITHRVLKMQNPTRIYGIGSNQVLQITFVALTQGQAIQNLWTPFYGYVTGAPWFKKYHELMAYYDAKYGQEMVRIKDTYILYRHRNLLILPASPDQRTLRGRTRIACVPDEIGWMDNSAEATKKVTVSASGTYAALSNSLQTVRSEEQRLIASGMVDCISGYMINISSPSSIRDKICELYRLSQGSKKMLGLHAPTWKINPKFSRATLDEDFRKDPIGAERDFGANPPLSSAPFIRDPTIIFGNVKAGKNYVNYKHQVNIGNDVERTKTRFASLVGCKEGTAPSVLAIDAGETNNSFAMAVMSMQNAIMSIDCLVDIMPLPGIPLNYSLIYKEIIVPMCKARNVRVVLSDRWNSTKLLQDLFDMAIVGKYQKYSLKYEDMWNFKSRLEQRSVAIPKSIMLTAAEQLRSLDVSDYPRCFENRPVEHFMFQCVTVQDTGRMVIKGPDMTDDLWRAVVLGAWGLENPDFKYYMQETKAKDRLDPRRLGVAKGGSSATVAGMEGGSRVGNFNVVRKKRGGFDS